MKSKAQSLFERALDSGLDDKDGIKDKVEKGVSEVQVKNKLTKLKNKENYENNLVGVHFNKVEKFYRKSKGKYKMRQMAMPKEIVMNTIQNPENKIPYQSKVGYLNNETTDLSLLQIKMPYTLSNATVDLNMMMKENFKSMLKGYHELINLS